MATRLNAVEHGTVGDEQFLKQFIDQSLWDEPGLLDGVQHRLR